MIINEWNPLKEIIVGASYDNCDINGVDKIVEETNEDLDELQNILEDLGVVVYRPIRPKFSLDIHHPIMPRDILGIYDNIIVKAYGAVHSRIRELECYVDILKNIHEYELIEMPVPNIIQTEEYEIIQDHTNKIKMQQRYDKYENEVLYETANILKCNDMLLHTQTARKDTAN